MHSRVQDPVRVELPCSYCRDPGQRERFVFCAACLAPHHPDCFSEHGRCSVHGCGSRTVVRPTAASEAGPRAASLPPARSARAAALYGLGLVVCIVLGWWLARSPTQPPPTPGAFERMRGRLEYLEREVDTYRARYDLEPEPQRVRVWREVPTGEGCYVRELEVNATLFTDHGVFALFDEVAVPLGGCVESVREGIWTVREIAPRSVVLENVHGESRTLRIHY